MQELHLIVIANFSAKQIVQGFNDFRKAFFSQGRGVSRYQRRCLVLKGVLPGRRLILAVALPVWSIGEIRAVLKEAVRLQ